MKVRVAYTLDVDADAWASEFRVPAFEVRADVRDYFETAMVAHLRDTLQLAADEDETATV